MKKLITALVALSLFATSCEFFFENVANPKDEVNDGTNDGNEEGDVPSDSLDGGTITLDNPENDYFLLDCRAQSIDIGFTADNYWLIECHEEWITPSMTEGEEGHYTVTLDIAENIEGHVRGSAVTFHVNGGPEMAVIIEQTESAVFELNDDTIYIDSDGGYIDAHVATNMEYTVHIPEEASSWIEYYETRTVRNETIVLRAEQNESTAERSAIIEIRDLNDELLSSFTVIQAGEDVDFWTDSRAEYNISSIGDTIEIYVRANIDYDIHIPEDATWVAHTETLPETRTTRWETVVMEIARNDNDEDRSTTIEFRDTSDKVLESIDIKQAALSVVTYTTADGSILDVLDHWTFDVDIVSNTYENGIGTILTNGRLTSIHDVAFYKNTNLVSINLPNSITTIGQEAFYGCTALTSIVIPESVTTMGRDVFKMCNSLSSATLNNTMTEIPWGMFYGCSSLTHIDIPQCVTKIGYEAFSHCSSLVIDAIPESITEIERYAFSRCTSITKLHISSNLKKVGGGAFDYCDNIKEVDIDDLSAWCKIEFEATSANPLDSGHFLYVNGNQLSRLEIPSDITEVKSCTFSGCLSIASVTIGNHVSHIGDFAFYDCEILSVSIGDGVTEIGSCAFAYNKTLSTLNLGKNIESIGNSAFYNCDALTSVTLPSKLKTIGEEAFHGCSITSINMPSSVKSIGDLAFSSISELHISSLAAWCDIDFERSMLYSSDFKAYLNGSLIEALEIPNGVKVIKPYTFYDWDNLTSITLADSVTEIGDYAFYRCGELESLDLGKGLQTIGIHTFERCSVDDITIPAGVNHIGEYAFSDTISKSLTFKGGVESIGKYAFEYCGAETITLPYGTKNIGLRAFSSCTNLTRVNISSSVETIGGGCFMGCTKLARVDCEPKTPPIIEGAYADYLFDDEATNLKIYVPDETYNDYQNAYIWRNYKDKMVSYDF